MSDTTLYDTTAPSEGSLALAHEQLIRLKMDGVFVNITGDINNLVLNPTKIPVAREVYGTKGLPSEQILGYSYAPTFNVEVVRDPATKQIVAAQGWYKDLVKASFSKGANNLRDFQIFTDAFDEDMPVVEGTFSVAFTPANSGYADKRVDSFTLTSSGVVPEIESPLAGTGEPILESAGPSGQTVGDLIKVRGYKLGSPVSATIDGQNVTKILRIDEYTVGLLIPATVAGSAPIVITNEVGASDPLPYTAA